MDDFRSRFLPKGKALSGLDLLTASSVTSRIAGMFHGILQLIGLGSLGVTQVLAREAK